MKTIDTGAQKIRLNQQHGLTKRSCSGRLILALMLVALSGCVTGGKVAVQPTPAEGAPVENSAGERPALPSQPLPKGFVIKERPDMIRAARKDFERAVELLQAGDDAGAVALLEPVVAAGPNVSAPYINLGIAYARTGKADKAETQFKKALDIFPGHPVASNAYGLLCRKAGRFDEARALYEQALDNYPAYYPVHKNLGILCDLYLNDPACALAHYEQYSVAQPDDKQAKMWIADLRNRMGGQ